MTGQLLVDDGQNVLQYSQMFHVSPSRRHITGVGGCRVLTETAGPGGIGLLCPERRFPIVGHPSCTAYEVELISQGIRIERKSWKTTRDLGLMMREYSDARTGMGMGMAHDYCQTTLCGLGLLMHLAGTTSVRMSRNHTDDCHLSAAHRAILNRP